MMLRQPRSTLFPYTTLFRSMGMDEAKLSGLRGRRIAMVFQDPAASLNPTLTLGRQLTEVITRHRGLRSEEHTSDSSHMSISYAVFCLKKKNKKKNIKHIQEH